MTESVSTVIVMNLPGLTLLETQLFCAHSSPVQKFNGQCSVVLDVQATNVLDVHTLNKVSNVQCMTSANVQSFCRGFT